MADDEFFDASGTPIQATQQQTPTVGVFLEEIGYFLEDMKKDLWWLLRAAWQPNGEVFLRGNESLEPVSAEKEAMIQNLRERFTLHVDSHENQVRTKIAIIPTVNAEEMELLSALRKLKFHCHGKIEVFSCMKEANNAAIWNAYHNFVANQEPQWMLETDGVGAKLTFAQCAYLVPFHLDAATKEIKILHVFCPDKKKRHWSFAGGDIARGIDTNIYDAARREFNDEIGSFFGRSWKECFEEELPAEGCSTFPGKLNCQFVNLEKDGVRYPCRPYFLTKVTDEFYNSTRAYEDANGVVKLPTPSREFLRWDNMNDETAQRMHTDGVAFAEHDEARWLNLDFETGRLWTEDNRAIRKENTELFKAQPLKIWEFFCSLLGCEMPEIAPKLPADFAADGTFAVRVSGIDKTAENTHIAEFFEAGGQITTKNIKKFDVPKHTARVEVEDMKQLELALGMNGHMLLRRKVKVEIWTEDTVASTDTGVPGQRPLEKYTGSLPDEGPFKAYIKGLDRTVTRDCLGYFFWDRDCLVHDVDFPVKGEKHAGCIEFQDQNSLRNALSLNNAIFRGREVVIELYANQDKLAEARGGGGGGGGGGGRRDDGPRRDKGYGKGGGGGFGDRGGGGKGGGGKGGGGFGRDDRAPPSRSEFGSERPRLQLKPRTVGADGNRDDRQQGAGGRADPFGGARPRDDRFAHTRADEDSNWRT